MATILVVDDDEQVRDFLAACLRRAGHQVVAAEDGLHALNCADSMSIDVILTDIFMPECDGLEIITHLRKFRPTIKAVAISGGGTRVSHDFLPIAEVLGAHRVLAKPLAPAALLHAIDDVLAS